jgi:glutamine amidotransferase
MPATSAESLGSLPADDEASVVPDNMIAIVDYRAGNLTSVQRALDALGFASRITADPKEVQNAQRIVFPGVGAAGEAMRNLRELGLDTVIKEQVSQGKPFLGICLGYQVLFEHSDENDVDCLGILRGNVVRFADGMRDEGSAIPLKIPEMGWNEVCFRGTHPVWHDIPAGSEFYLVHSYYPVPDQQVVGATAEYGIEYACGVASGSLVAFQFHPEKSGRPGLRLLKNFCEWQP